MRALVALLLCARGAHAALSADGSLASGAWNYAPTYPSVLPAAAGGLTAPFAFTPGVTNATKFNASAVATTTGLVCARLQAAQRLRLQARA